MSDVAELTEKDVMNSVGQEFVRRIIDKPYLEMIFRSVMRNHGEEGVIMLSEMLLRVRGDIRGAILLVRNNCINLEKIQSRQINDGITESEENHADDRREKRAAAAAKSKGK